MIEPSPKRARLEEDNVFESWDNVSCDGSEVFMVSGAGQSLLNCSTAVRAGWGAARRQQEQVEYVCRVMVETPEWKCSVLTPGNPVNVMSTERVLNKTWHEGPSPISQHLRRMKGAVGFMEVPDEELPLDLSKLYPHVDVAESHAQHGRVPAAAIVMVLATLGSKQMTPNSEDGACVEVLCGRLRVRVWKDDDVCAVREHGFEADEVHDVEADQALFVPSGCVYEWVAVEESIALLVSWGIDDQQVE